MKRYKIKIALFLWMQLFFYTGIFAQTKVWNITFEENQARLGVEQTESLSKLISYLSKQDNESLKIELEGRFDNPNDFAEANRLFNQRSKAITDYLINNQVVSKAYFDEPLFQFAKSVGAASDVDTSIKASQLVRIFLHYNITSTSNTIASNSNIKNQTNTKKSNKSSTPNPVRTISENIEEKRPEHITVKCSPLTNSVSFKYYCGQSVTIIDVKGIEVKLEKNAIQGCYDGMQLFVKLKSAITTEELIELGNLTPNKKKYFRLGNYVHFRIGSNNNQVVKLKGCLSLKIPSNRIEEANLGIMRNKAWRTVKKPNAFKYANGAYEIKYCFEFQNHVAFGIGQPSYKEIYVRIDNKETYARAIANNPSEPIMVYKDGSIAFLNTSWKRDSDVKTKFWKYYEFPIYKDLKIEGVLHDDYLMTTLASFTSYRSWEQSERQLALYKMQANISLSTNSKGKIQGTRKERVVKRKEVVYKINNVHYQMVKYKPAVLDGGYTSENKKDRRRQLKYAEKGYLPVRKEIKFKKNKR